MVNVFCCEAPSTCTIRRSCTSSHSQYEFASFCRLDHVSRVSSGHCVPVGWISPCGLPCLQPYFEYTSTVIKTPLQMITVSREDAVKSTNARRQKTGLPPNFIHSLDASHMLMTGAKCLNAGKVMSSIFQADLLLYHENCDCRTAQRDDDFDTLVSFFIFIRSLIRCGP